MRITVLGYQSPYPGPGGATPGYLIETERVKILLDCGSGVLAQLGKHLPIYELDAMLLSHYHHDHVADVGVMQYGLMVHQLFGQRPTDKPLPIYAPALPVVNAQTLVYREATTFTPITEETSVTIGDVVITFLRTDHGDGDPCYAMRLEANGRVLVYGADSGPGTAWEGFASQADLFICEGTYLDYNLPAKPNGHLSVRQAAELAQSLSCRSLLVTHLFYGYDESQVIAEAHAFVAGPVYAARIGLQIDL
ncbi:MBL fold metallo-hydrolase [Brevibacillus formosus]|uniref:MBL fold metallo-hydrolase n=1 Tax=Brevibacillus TaxID=55080 RepID=UPI000D0F6E75|nr:MULTISPECIES: MBL fold metallo-hydrolase [Brevibacillus]MBG9945194.1 metal-dependent hydrolase [Brevibacillus formosus]MED1943537.1 MBL fold metallo-hydrolase [Brevibacillus formosus]MED2000091.1 MBL fold metallo-hydrolase [Brevibacillus formosus]MED2081772.1 MBL fold metallo-hydrolase [Brevibacillus formosus]PSK19281.1 metal-dependent hydrolase [Brevibacillus sp. NRRL NRS-603]